MALLIETNFPQIITNQALKSKLQPLMPEVEIRFAPDYGNLDQIIMFACNNLPSGLIWKLQNLQLVQRLGAGVEAILENPELPKDIQVARLKPDQMAQEIAHYCLAHVLYDHRNLQLHKINQDSKQWIDKAPRLVKNTTVGVLGLGHMGREIATTFAKLGFRVLGWSSTRKNLQNITSLVGIESLGQLLEESDYIISVLPSTSETRGLFDLKMLSKLKDEAVLLNVGRGDLIVESDLISALNDARFARAILDVFDAEPLPAEHPFWSHPKITITPHVSGWSLGSSLEIVASNYRRLVNGQPLLNLVNRDTGY